MASGTGLSPREVEALLDEWLGRLYGLALNVLGNAADAEDAVQNAALAVVRGAGRFRRGEPAAPWVWRLGVNASVDVMRRRGREVSMESEPEAPVKAGAESHELRAAVRAAVRTLPEPERLSMVLHYFQGLPRREVARVLALPEGTVSSHLARGRERLRARLAGLGAAFVALPAAALERAMSEAGTARVPALLRSNVRRLARARTPGAAKGGMAMKIAAGVVLAGAAIGVAALSVPGGGPPPSASPVKGPPTREHFAFINQYGYLDGPKREAQAGRGPRICADAKGNLYFFAAHYYGALRCIRTDGQIVTISGNDYWNSDMPLAEGPASCLGNPYGVRGMSFGLPTGTLVVEGVPDEGAGKGCIYTTDPYKNVVRVFRNEEKGNRWWFERIAGGGKAGAPGKRGQSVAAQEVAFRGMPRVQHDKDGKLVVFVDGGFYRTENDKLTCLLGPADYAGKVGKARGASEGYLGGDGSFYLSFYYGGGPVIYRVSPDAARCELHAKDVTHGLAMKDGQATAAEWACGPHLRPMINNVRYQPADVVFTSSHDEAVLRRVRDGRVSTLCKDGEWREMVGKGAFKQALSWFRNWCPGPDGTAYLTYTDHKGVRTWRITGIDADKPTAGAK